MVFTVLATGRAGVDRIKHDEVGTLDHALGRPLAELSREGDRVVTSGTYAGSAVAIFYSRRKGWLFPPPQGADQRGFHIYRAVAHHYHVGHSTIVRALERAAQSS